MILFKSSRDMHECFLSPLFLCAYENSWKIKIVITKERQDRQIVVPITGIPRDICRVQHLCGDERIEETQLFSAKPFMIRALEDLSGRKSVIKIMEKNVLGFQDLRNLRYDSFDQPTLDTISERMKQYIESEVFQFSDIEL